jgi:hypothetical protein
MTATDAFIKFVRDVLVEAQSRRYLALVASERGKR